MFGCGFEVDGVIAHACAAHHLQLGQRFEHAPGEVSVGREHAVGTCSVLDDALRDAAQQQVHREDEDAAAKENPADDKVRIAKDADCQISHEEEGKQDDGQVEYAFVAAPAAVALEVLNKAHEAVDVVDHECTTQIHQDQTGLTQHGAHLPPNPIIID